MKKQAVIVDKDQISTLKELAKELQVSYKWKSYKVKPDCILFTVEEDSVDIECRLETTGFAYRNDTDDPIDEYNVDWNDVFDGWSDFVWATDVDGNTVMIHS